MNADPLMDEEGDKIISESNDGRHCNMEELTFVGDQGGKDLVDTEDDVEYIGDGWLWNKW